MKLCLMYIQAYQPKLQLGSLNGDARHAALWVLQGGTKDETAVDATPGATFYGLSEGLRLLNAAC